MRFRGHRHPVGNNDLGSGPPQSLGHLVKHSGQNPCVPTWRDSGVRVRRSPWLQGRLRPPGHETRAVSNLQSACSWSRQTTGEGHTAWLSTLVTPGPRPPSAPPRTALGLAQTGAAGAAPHPPRPASAGGRPCRDSGHHWKTPQAPSSCQGVSGMQHARHQACEA